MSELVKECSREGEESSLDLEAQEKYREDLFGVEDFLFYRGIARFYSKNYEEAARDFEASIAAKREAATLTLCGNRSQSENPCDSVDTDLSDVGLCAVNVNEYHFNVILCFIMVTCARQLDEGHEGGAGAVHRDDGRTAAEVPGRGVAAARTAQRGGGRRRGGAEEF